nr:MULTISPECIES: lipopolysaccharide assembly protein LapA domain-containing protein [Pseudomonas]
MVFAIENPQPVSIVVLGRSAPQLPVSLLLTLAFLMGMIIAPIFTALVLLRRRRLPGKGL